MLGYFISITYQGDNMQIKVNQKELQLSDDDINIGSEPELSYFHMKMKLL